MKKIFCIILAVFSISALPAQEGQKPCAKSAACAGAPAAQKACAAAKAANSGKTNCLPPEKRAQFLKEELEVEEPVNFEAMFEEVKTYGGFSGLCSQMSEYIKQTKRCPELFKFKTKRIHSCDGFFMVKNGWVIFCPTSKQINIIAKNKIFAMYLDKNFAVCLKPDFYKYLTSTTEGMDE